MVKITMRYRRRQRAGGQLVSSPPPHLTNTGRPVSSGFVQYLIKPSRLYRYCISAAATESMAVSSLRPPTTYVPHYGPFTEPSQTHPYTQDGPASILYNRNHLCSNRGASALRQCSGASTPVRIPTPPRLIDSLIGARNIYRLYSLSDGDPEQYRFSAHTSQICFLVIQRLQFELHK